MISPKDVVVGNTYKVPSGIATISRKIIPIIFPMHRDGKEICVNPLAEHYHIDKRFTKLLEYDDVYLSSHLENVQYRDMICVQENTFLNKNYIFSIEKLHQIYKNNELKNNICPHQGTEILNKCGTCPNHGLIWNLETKRLKYKLPFYFVNGNNKGEIKDGFCKIKIEDKLQYSGENLLVFKLVDSEGKEYHNCEFIVSPTSKYLKIGDTIEIKDNNCYSIRI